SLRAGVVDGRRGRALQAPVELVELLERGAELGAFGIEQTRRGAEQARLRRECASRLETSFLALGRGGGSALRERQRFARDLEPQLDGAGVRVERAFARLLGGDFTLARRERRLGFGRASFGTPQPVERDRALVGGERLLTEDLRGGGLFGCVGLFGLPAQAFGARESLWSARSRGVHGGARARR